MAQAESGTLKVKILRHDQTPADNRTCATSVFPFSNAIGTRNSRRAAVQPPHMSRSPPKPRPNRKHVPIFYEPQFRQPIWRRSRRRRSNNESGTPSAPSTSVADISLTSPTEVHAPDDAATGAPHALPQLLDVRLRSASSSEVRRDLSPKTSPLVVRKETDEVEANGELEHLSSSESSSLCLNSWSEGLQMMGTTATSAELQKDPNVGKASARDHSASSSTNHHLARDGPVASTQLQLSALSSTDDLAAVVTKIPSSSINGSTKILDTADCGTNGRPEDSRSEPLAVSQTATDPVSSASSTKHSRNKEQGGKHREICGPNSTSRSGCSEATHSSGSRSMVATVEPSSRPPTLNLVVEDRTQVSELPFIIGGSEDTLVCNSLDECASGMAITLDSPPDAPLVLPSHNSLVGGSISSLTLPKTAPSLDGSGSLSSVTSDTNETMKDLNSVPALPARTHLSPDGLATMTRVNCEVSDPCKRKASHIAMAGFGSRASCSDATYNTVTCSCNATSGLGPPPSDPPAFTIGNSLMGGGIELQLAASPVNTHNFDWKPQRPAWHIDDTTRSIGHR
ncbi:unnamed protein product [Hyaloperonospora brassicae]|uniref:Uncharacterized protein n=1 Tax=Hyaloperonospora brassicae TaxID=162125 RepID=A0AAV0U683_HYABA|nr:unnamed protein product [Hyaloperonospora brassicae]